MSAALNFPLLLPLALCKRCDKTFTQTNPADLHYTPCAKQIAREMAQEEMRQSDLFAQNETLRQQNRELRAELLLLRDRAELCKKWQLTAAGYLKERDEWKWVANQQAMELGGIQ